MNLITPAMAKGDLAYGREPAHHLKLNRNKELRERLSCRRRGYQITTTDSLLHEINTTGITVVEQSDGYH